MSDEPLVCGVCGTPMNHQADKLVVVAPDDDEQQLTPGFDGVIERVYACPRCGRIAARRDPGPA